MPPIRVALDTTAVNWFCNHPEEAAIFYTAKDSGRIEVLVMPEVATEVRRTTQPQRRSDLEQVLQRFFPLQPTRHPRAGFRAGMGRMPTAADEARLESLGVLRGVVDRALASNAGGYRCDVFLTNDHEISRHKKAAVEAALGGTRVVEPEVFIEELRAATA